MTAWGIFLVVLGGGAYFLLCVRLMGEEVAVLFNRLASCVGLQTRVRITSPPHLLEVETTLSPPAGGAICSSTLRVTSCATPLEPLSAGQTARA